MRDIIFLKKDFDTATWSEFICINNVDSER